MRDKGMRQGEGGRGGVRGILEGDVRENGQGG